MSRGLGVVSRYIIISLVPTFLRYSEVPQVRVGRPNIGTIAVGSLNKTKKVGSSPLLWKAPAIPTPRPTTLRRVWVSLPTLVLSVLALTQVGLRADGLYRPRWEEGLGVEVTGDSGVDT